MADSITLTLPEPPSSNRYWRRHGAIIHVSAVAKAYKEAVNMLTSRYRKGSECAFPSGDLSVTVLWHRSAKRGDLPNRTKVLYDALQGTIYRDDKQIAVEHTMRVDQHATLKRGFMRVTISRLGSRGPLRRIADVTGAPGLHELANAYEKLARV